MLEADRKCDSLSKVYGSLSADQSAIFKSSVASYQRQLFQFNEIDKNVKFEKYLLSVFKQMNPKATYTPQVYLFRSSYPNAFTVFNGDIFFHWAFIADLEDEAGLAFTMGHEVTHYDASHLYLSYLNNGRTKNSTRNQVIDNYRFEQKQEYFADSVGYVLGARAGYKWQSGLSDFYEFMSLDTILHYMHKKANVYNADGYLVNDVYYNDRSDTLFTTHPPTNSRVQRWRAWGSNNGNEGKKFIVDEVLFHEFQDYCREQTLGRYLKEQELKLGLIKSFKYYILNPNSKKLKYYFLEFTRRYVAAFPSVGKQVFMADIFNLEGDKSILNNLRWIFRNEVDLVKAKEYLPEFFKGTTDTYAEVISTLCASQKNQYPEFYLSLAMLNSKNENLKLNYLQQYLSFEKVDFRDFAIAYRDKELAYKFRDFNNRLAIYGGTRFFGRTEFGILSEVSARNRFEEEVNEKLYEFIDHKKIENTKIVDEEYLLEKGMYNDFVAIAKPWLLADANDGNATRSGLMLNNSNSSALLSPDLWTFLYYNRISEIIYLQAYSIQDYNISSFANFLSYFNAVARTNYGRDQNYFGRTRHLYFVDFYALNNNGFILKEQEVAVKSKLNADLLLTEIYLLLK